MKSAFKWLVCIGASICMGSCSDTMRAIDFKGISADVTTGLYNPGRGFRLETAVDVVKDTACPTKELDDLSRKYEADSVSLTQCYFYLTDLAEKDITENHLKTMQAYFDEMKRLGKKAVLRFAYERDFKGRSPVGPTEERILRNADLLQPFIEKNKELILAVQAGMIGAWGEWHSSIQGLENSSETKRRILEKMLSIVPEELNVQVRMPYYKNLVKDVPELYKRVSFHNDFIVIKADVWDGGLHEGTEVFNQMVEESPYLVIDGELPWGFWSVGDDPDSPTAGWLIEGLPAARELCLCHYTSLSIIHNYKEQHTSNDFGEKNSPEYSMALWKKTLVSEDSIRKYGLPVSDKYFQNSKGEIVRRSMFDYIRDHLGYRLELQKLRLSSIWQIGKSVELDLTLINRGFATVYGKHSVSWVLINEAGKVISFPTAVNPEEWQPYNPGDATHMPLVHHVQTRFVLPEKLAKGTYKLGLWLDDASFSLSGNSRYAIRCANEGILWWTDKDGKYGINVLTQVRVH